MQQAQESDGDQAGVVEVFALHAVQQSGDWSRCAFAAVAQPALDLIEAVVAHLGSGVGCHLTEGRPIEAVGAAKGLEQGLPLRLGLVTVGEAVKHLGQTNGKEAIGLEPLLMAQQVQFHQEFVHQAAIERRDDVGERLVKGPLAIGNGQARTHAQTSIKFRRP